MKLFTRIAGLLAFALASIVSTPLAAQAINGATLVGICLYQTNGTCLPVSGSAPVPISGTFSATLSGFTPGGTYAALSASTTSARVALPAGTVVVIWNTGANNAFVTLGDNTATATTAHIPLAAGAWLALTPGSNTNLAAITSSGTTTLTLVGGAGLPTGALSGTGGGGSVPTGAAGTPNVSVLSVQGITSMTPLKVDGSAVTQPVSGTITANIGTGGSLATAANQVATNTTLSTINTTLGSPFQAGGSIGNTAFGISGTLPAFAATPTFNLGTLNGAATAANQTAVQSSPGTSAGTALTVQGSATGVPLPVLNTGATNFVTGQSSIATTASLIVNARTGRQSVTVVNHGTTAIYIGGASVTTSTGVLLPGILGASVTIPTTVALYGIVASGTATVSEYETF